MEFLGHRFDPHIGNEADSFEQSGFIFNNNLMASAPMIKNGKRAKRAGKAESFFVRFAPLTICSHRANVFAGERPRSNQKNGID
ncbi:MAG TPA: hypothetical protein VFY40_17535 [Blastocatellia bacterium]|nr:hypothetical protein [Blastocatellia bacterium]